MDGTFLGPSPTGGGAVPLGSGPCRFGTFTYAFSDQSIRVREAADRTMARLAAHRGLGRFMKLTETRGLYAAHPLGGLRMHESPGARRDHPGRARARVRGAVLRSGPRSSRRRWASTRR